MKEFADSVNKFLSFNEYKVLTGYGKVLRGVADQKAEKGYEIFNRTQPVFSDFDAEIKRLEDGRKYIAEKGLETIRRHAETFFASPSIPAFALRKICASPNESCRAADSAMIRRATGVARFC